MFFGQSGAGAPNLAAIGGQPAPNLALLANVEHRVPGAWTVKGGELVPLKGKVTPVPTPLDDGIQPGPGDDTAPPNAPKADQVNRLVAHVLANIGFSASTQQEAVPPSALDMQIAVRDVSDAGRRQYALDLALCVEFKNANPSESMMVWLKRMKQRLAESELVLVDTVFSDWVNGAWVEIATDVRYAAAAEAVQQAVLQSDSGQAAGTLTQSADMESAKIGPVGDKCQVKLTYTCAELYSYQELPLDGVDRDRHLVPLLVDVPYAPPDSLAGQCALSVQVKGPVRSEPVAIAQNFAALKHWVDNTERAGGGFANAQAVLLVPEPGPASGSDYSWQAPVLPPCATTLLFWLACPGDDWLDVGTLPLQGGQSALTVLQPDPEDQPFLAAQLPEGPVHLLRCKLKLDPDQAAFGTDEAPPRVHTDFVVSDASGSTGMRRGPLTTRAALNRYEELRFLGRLEALPKIVQAGVLRPADEWRVQFLVFDHGVREEFAFRCKCGDYSADQAAVVKRAAAGDAAAMAQLAQSPGAQAAARCALECVQKLQGLGPGGTTNFACAAKKAKEVAANSKAQATTPGQLCTAFVNWDTDGGNNSPDCYSSMKALAKTTVVGGFVLGMGAWVDQDCATQCARILRGPCVLALEPPTEGTAAMDATYRKDMSTWVRALRAVPLDAKLHAGSHQWRARTGPRTANALEVAAAIAPPDAAVRFGLPDVSDPVVDATVLEGLAAGDEVELLLLSRRPAGELPQHLQVQVRRNQRPVPVPVSVQPEPLHGLLLAHRWLRALAGTGSVKNAAGLPPRAQHAVEDALSFHFNLPALDGSTARLGRAKTQHRAPIPESQQPAEPSVQLASLDGGVFGGGLFGGGARRSRAPGPAPCGAWSLPASGGGKGKGGKGTGGAAPFGAPVRMAAPAPAAPAARGAFGAPAAAASSLFGAPAAAAAPPKPPPGAALFGSAKARKMKPAPRWGGGWSDESDGEPAAAPGAPSAAEVLRATKFLCQGCAYAGEAVVNKVRVLCATAAATTAVVGQAEDPLVGQLLGAPPAGATHSAHTCDGCGTAPMRGPRYHSLTHDDFDLCPACYAKGVDAANRAAFVKVALPIDALRHVLAVLQFWGALYGLTPEQLAAVRGLQYASAQDLAQKLHADAGLFAKVAVE